MIAVHFSVVDHLCLLYCQVLTVEIGPHIQTMYVESQTSFPLDIQTLYDDDCGTLP